MGGRAESLLRVAERLLPLAPLLFAVPVLVALGHSLADLLSSADPYVGDISGIDIDALNIHLGGPLYQDPAHGYTPLDYTPLFPAAWAGLDYLHGWAGWGLLMSLASVGSLGAMAAWLAYSPRDRSRGEVATAAVTAVAVGALVFWLVGFVPFNFRFLPRVDHASWAPALLALLLMPRVAGGSRRAAIAAVLLLTVAFWTKQSAVFAALAAAGWLGIAALGGRARVRRAALFSLALLVVNGGIFLAIEAATGGWMSFFLLDEPARHRTSTGLGDAFTELLQALSGTALVLAVVCAALAAPRIRASGLAMPRPRWASSLRGQIASVLAFFIAIDTLPALRFRGGEGAVANQYLGIAWAAGLLMAIGYGAAGRRRGAAIATGLSVLALFAVSESRRLQARLADDLSINVPAKSARAKVSERSRALAAYARTRFVYHPVFSTVRPASEVRLYPNQENIQAILVAGDQPRFLVDALLTRRFDAVFQFEDTHQRNVGSGTGTYEDNYPWKLNRIITAKYRPAVDAPPEVLRQRKVPALFGFRSAGLWERRPGADPAPWMRRCFAPFRIGADTWRIRRGGGFWCRPAGVRNRLRMVETPALVSEVRTDRRGAGLGGEVTVLLPRAAGRFSIGLGEWTVEGQRLGNHVALVTADSGRRWGAATLRGSRIRLAFRTEFADHGRLRRMGPGRVLLTLPLTGPRPASVRASAGSRAEFVLDGLRLLSLDGH